MRDACTLYFVHTCTLAGVLCVCFSFEGVIATYCVFLLLVQMFVAPYIGFANGSCLSTWNLSSAAWVIYDPHGELVDLQGVCLRCTTNNVAEYSTVIELLAEAVDINIRTLNVNLDSQLVVLQLNRRYCIRNPQILRLYLRVCLLERNFDYITYQHIPRRLNTLTNALANHVLDRHLRNL